MPTIAEGGLAGYEFDAWFGIFAPGKTARAVVNQINAAIGRIVNVPDVKDRMRVQGVVLKSSTPCRIQQADGGRRRYLQQDRESGGY